jgi:hypothetical protein
MLWATHSRPVKAPKGLTVNMPRTLNVMAWEIE